MKTIIQILLFTTTMLIGSQVQATSFFESVEVDWTSENLFESRVKLSDPVNSEAIKVSYINQTIQFDIPNSVIEADNSKTIVNKNNFKSVYIYQTANKNLRVRVILDKPTKASKYKKSVKYFVEGNQLVLQVKNPEVTWAQVNGNKNTIKPINLDAELKKALSVEEKEKTANDILQSEMETMVAAPKPSVKKVAKKAEKEQKKETKKTDSKVTESKTIAGIDDREKPESEIPVFSKTESKKAEAQSPLLKMIMSLVVILLLGVGSVLFAKWYAKNNKKTLDNNKIRVLTQHHLGPKKSLAIIRVAGESILLGVTDHNISMIKTLSLVDDEIPINVPTNFSKTLEMTEKEDVETAHLDDEVLPSEKEAEQFAYGNIKSVITSKIKGMRQI